MSGSNGNFKNALYGLLMACNVTHENGDNKPIVLDMVSADDN
jgi:hypothetical protein